MRSSLSGASLIAAALFPLAPPLSAQTIPSVYDYLEARQEIGPFVGPMTASEGRFGLGPSGGLTYGARYAIELTGPLAFEGMTGLVDGERQVVDPTRLEGDRVIGEVDSHVLLINAGFRFTLTGRRSWRSLAPFISASGGIAVDLLDTSSLDETLLPEDVFDFGNSFFATLGVGTRWFVSDRIATRLDGTFSLWKIDTPPGFSDPSRGFENVDNSQWVAGQALTLTLLYRW